MLCKDCEYFKILQEPISHFDCGIAICEKHNLSVDFLSHGKFKWLSCIEDKHISRKEQWDETCN